MIQRYKDIMFNSFSKASNNISRIIKFKPILGYLETYTGDILFKPILTVSHYIRDISFKPVLDIASNIRDIKFKPQLPLDIATVVFKPIISTITNTVRFIPQLNISNYTIKFLLLEVETITYDVKFEIYNVEDCDNEFITLNC